MRLVIIIAFRVLDYAEFSIFSVHSVHVLLLLLLLPLYVPRRSVLLLFYHSDCQSPNDFDFQPAYNNIGDSILFFFSLTGQRGKDLRIRVS